MHRPEVCYPAFGFTLVGNRAVNLPIGAGVSLPVRQLVAQNDDGKQYITYWSRLGEFLPQDGGAQREARFLNAFRGIVPDGVLCRFNTWGREPDDAWHVTNTLVADLLKAVPPAGRKALIGTERAVALKV